jgi:hypothetical protein
MDAHIAADTPAATPAPLSEADRYCFEMLILQSGKARLIAKNPPSELVEAIQTARAAILPFVNVYPWPSVYWKRMDAAFRGVNDLAGLLNLKAEKKPAKHGANGKRGGADWRLNRDMQAQMIASNPPQGLSEAVHQARRALHTHLDLFPHFSSYGEAMREAVNRLDRVALDLGLMGDTHA